MENLYRKTEKHVEFICNYMDDEWLDIVGTNGMRVSIPSILVKSEVLPDDVLSIEVKRDDIKTVKRRQGKLSTMIDLQVLSKSKNPTASVKETISSANSNQGELSNIIYFPDSYTEANPLDSFDNHIKYTNTGKRFNVKGCALRKKNGKNKIY